MKKINKKNLRKVIQEEFANLQQEGLFDWFGGGDKEEASPSQEASAGPEQEALALWDALVEEFKEVYRGATDGIPHIDDCRTMDCEKHLKDFWATWDMVNPNIK